MIKDLYWEDFNVTRSAGEEKKADLKVMLQNTLNLHWCKNYEDILVFLFDNLIVFNWGQKKKRTELI